MNYWGTHVWKQTKNLITVHGSAFLSVSLLTGAEPLVLAVLISLFLLTVLCHSGGHFIFHTVCSTKMILEVELYLVFFCMEHNINFPFKWKRKKKERERETPLWLGKKKMLCLKKQWNIFIHVLLSLECYTKKYHRLGGLKQ